MKEGRFGYLVNGNKGLIYTDDRFLYFPNRGSNLKEGIISNIRNVKDFTDDRGYAFIEADMIKTEAFTYEDLCNIVSDFSGVKKLQLGGSEIIIGFKSRDNFDFGLFTKLSGNYVSMSAFFKCDGKVQTLFYNIKDRAFTREPYRTFLKNAKPLAVGFLKQYCRSHFVGSDLFRQLGLLKVVRENNTFLNQTTFSYNADLGIYKVIINFDYANVATVKYCFYNGKRLLQTTNIEELGAIPFKEIPINTIRQIANDLHICVSANSFDTCIISDALCSKVYQLGGIPYLVYAYRINEINEDTFSDVKLHELVTQSSEDYMKALRKNAKNLTAKNISSLTLQSWYIKRV